MEHSTKPNKIMLVSSDPELVLPLHDFFASHAFAEMVICKSNEQAMGVLQSGSWSLIIIDMEMAAGDLDQAFWLIRRIRERDNWAMIALLTDNDDLFMDPRLLENGIDDLLIKNRNNMRLTIYRILLNLSRSRRWESLKCKMAGVNQDYSSLLQRMQSLTDQVTNGTS
jgi:DNA-binding response OmpR family regulator